VAFPVALMALGGAPPRVRTVTRSKAPANGWRARLFPAVLVLLLLLLEVSFFALLNLRGNLICAEWPAGVPLATWIQLVGVGLLPLLLVPAAYAVVFGRSGLSVEDLERVRASQREAGGSLPPSPPAATDREGG